MKTRVVHVRKEPFDVYIGRAFAEFPESPFRNKYRIGVHGTRAEVIERHRQDLKKNPGLVARVERELTGKKIG